MPLQRFSILWCKNGRTTGDFRLNQKLLKKMCRLCNDLRKIKQLFTHTKETNITPELSLTYKHLSFPQVEHPKLLFGDDLPKAIKELTETNKIGQSLSKKSYFQSSHIGSSSIFTNSNTAG